MKNSGSLVHKKTDSRTRISTLIFLPADTHTSLSPLANDSANHSHSIRIYKPKAQNTEKTIHD